MPDRTPNAPAPLWDTALARLSEARRTLVVVDTEPGAGAPADAAECLRISRTFADDALALMARADKLIRDGRTIAACARCGHPPGCCAECCPAEPGSTGTGAGCMECQGETWPGEWRGESERGVALVLPVSAPATDNTDMIRAMIRGAALALGGRIVNLADGGGS